jgi:hypothetical protein
MLCGTSCMAWLLDRYQTLTPRHPSYCCCYHGHGRRGYRALDDSCKVQPVRKKYFSNKYLLLKYFFCNIQTYLIICNIVSTTARPDEEVTKHNIQVLLLTFLGLAHIRYHLQDKPHVITTSNDINTPGHVRN